MPSENPFENHAEKADKSGLRFCECFCCTHAGAGDLCVAVCCGVAVMGVFSLQVVARMFVGAASYQRVAMP